MKKGGGDMWIWGVVIVLWLCGSVSAQPAPPPLLAFSLEQQACLALIESGVMQVLWPVADIVMALMVVMSIPFWPRRKIVDLILTEDEDGNIVQVRYTRYAHAWRGQLRAQQPEERV